jgi:phosphate-selective porin OprO/OprP
MVMRTIAVGTMVAMWALTGTVRAADTPDVAALMKRLDEQEQRIKALEAKLAAQSGSAAAARPANAPPAAVSVPGATPSVTEPTTAAAPAESVASVAPKNIEEVKVGPNGIVIQSADGSNSIRFRGNLAVDGRWFSDDITPASADTWLIRKARPYIEGTLDDIYDFRFMPDFGNGKAIILESYLAARFRPWLVFQAGKFKGPVGLERLQPDQFNRFIELAFPSSIVPNRDLGVEFAGDFGGGVLGYAVGAFDGALDGASTDSNSTPDTSSTGKKDWQARLFAQPFVHAANPYLRGLGFGVAGTYTNATGSTTSTLLTSYKTPGQQSFFSYRTGTTATYGDGRRSRLTPQVYYYAGGFGLIGEYVAERQDVSRQVSSTLKRSDTLDNSAWAVTLSYFLTGERSSYNSYTPGSTFQPGKPGWGAWELALRYHELAIDEAAFLGGASSFADPATSARRARAVGVGLNWYLNQNVKWMLDLEQTRFDGGAANGGDRPDERAILTRFQLAF